MQMSGQQLAEPGVSRSAADDVGSGEMALGDLLQMLDDGCGFRSQAVIDTADKVGIRGQGRLSVGHQHTIDLDPHITAGQVQFSSLRVNQQSPTRCRLGQGVDLVIGIMIIGAAPAGHQFIDQPEGGEITIDDDLAVKAPFVFQPGGKSFVRGQTMVGFDPDNHVGSDTDENALLVKTGNGGNGSRRIMGGGRDDQRPGVHAGLVGDSRQEGAFDRAGVADRAK